MRRRGWGPGTWNGVFLVGDALSHCFVSSETCWVLGLQLLQPVLISPPLYP